MNKRPDAKNIYGTIDNGKATKMQKIEQALSYGVITEEKADQMRQRILGNITTQKNQ